MSTDETARLCRAEIWNPRVLDRQPWDTWQAAGASDTHERIRARLRKILSQHVAPPLPEGAAGKIAAILEAAEARHAARSDL